MKIKKYLLSLSCHLPAPHSNFILITLFTFHNVLQQCKLLLKPKQSKYFTNHSEQDNTSTAGLFKAL